MKIEVIENKNIYYLYLIINLLGYTDDNGFPIHSIRKKSVEDFHDSLNSGTFLQLKEIYKSKKIYNSYLIDYALYSPERFTSIKFNQERFDKRFQKTKSFQRHLEFINLAIKAINELNIPEYYDKSIHKYISEKVKVLNEELLRLEINNSFDKFFRFIIEKNGIIIPNILEAYSRAYGFEKEESIITVTGFNSITDTGIDLDSELVILNLIHEFTHFYFDRIKEKHKDVFKSKEYRDNAKKSFKTLKKLLKDIDNEDLLNHYDNWDYYLEESIVRVVTYKYLIPSVFKSVWSTSDINDFVTKQINNLKNSGFYLTDKVIENIKSEPNWESIFRLELDK